MLARALERVERDGLHGARDRQRRPAHLQRRRRPRSPSCALAQGGDWKELDAAVRDFQDGDDEPAQAPFPVVVAPFGLTLGGGAEFTLHADRVQAHAELYMGLVEAGVGLHPRRRRHQGAAVPLHRASCSRTRRPTRSRRVKRAFKLIAMATTSTSALEARKLGFLRDARPHHA